MFNILPVYLKTYFKIHLNGFSLKKNNKKYEESYLNLRFRQLF